MKLQKSIFFVIVVMIFLCICTINGIAIGDLSDQPNADIKIFGGSARDEIHGAMLLSNANFFLFGNTKSEPGTGIIKERVTSDEGTFSAQDGWAFEMSPQGEVVNQYHIGNENRPDASVQIMGAAEVTEGLLLAAYDWSIDEAFIVFIDVKSGTIAKTTALKGIIETYSALDNGLFVAGKYRGSAWAALLSETGDLIWEYTNEKVDPETKTAFERCYNIPEGFALIQSANKLNSYGYSYILLSKTGEMLCNKQIDLGETFIGALYNGMLYSDNMIYVYGNIYMQYAGDSAFVFVLDVNGTLLWYRETPGMFIRSAIVIDSDPCFITTSGNSNFEDYSFTRIDKDGQIDKNAFYSGVNQIRGVVLDQSGALWLFGNIRLDVFAWKVAENVGSLR